MTTPLLPAYVGKPERNRVYHLDALAMLRWMPRKSIHSIITSPPYFGLRDYAAEGQIGLETSIEEYIASLVAIFHEARYVLRDEGVLWINIGDSYSQTGKWGGKSSSKNGYADVPRKKRQLKLGAKNLCGIPFRLALALQADGWILRSCAPWVKLSALPGSQTDRDTMTHEYILQFTKEPKYWFDADAVRREHAEVSKKRAMRGRKKNKYTSSDHMAGDSAQTLSKPQPALGYDNMEGKIANGETALHPNGRMRRTTDTFFDAIDAQIAFLQSLKESGGVCLDGDRLISITTGSEPMKHSHFAAFPKQLIAPLVLASCPEKCCAQCGAGYERVTEKTFVPQEDVSLARAAHRNKKLDKSNTWEGQPRGSNHIKTLGFVPTCTCNSHETTPGLVYDPFMGSGTTAVVASLLGRDFNGSELNNEYLTQIIPKRLEFESSMVEALPLFSF